MKFEEMILGQGQHGAIIGRTGCGKTVLARALLPSTGPLAIIDPKRAFKYPAPVFDNVKQLRRQKPQRFIFRPRPDDLSNLDLLNDVYKYVYDNPPYTLYTDDVSGIVTIHRVPAYLRICYMLGRERDIRCMASFQRPSALPPFLMSEATKFAVFKLVVPQDVKKVAEMVPGYALDRLTTKHTFLFYDSDKMQISQPVLLDLK